ncbi:MAG: primosomal protein N' [Rhodospirillales bacterium]
MADRRPEAVAADRRFQPGERVAVLLPLPLGSPYDYRIPADLALSEGDFVRVPFGRRTLTGVVWGTGSDAIGEDRLKDVLGRCETPPLSAATRRFVHWVAAYTVHPLGSVLRMVMSVPEAVQPAKATTACVLAPVAGTETRLTPARRRVLDLLADGRPRPVAELARAAGVGVPVVKALVATGLIATVERPPATPPRPDWRRPGAPLSPAQRSAAAQLRRAVGGGYSATVVDGVPGSGKTEVYFEAIAEALAQDRQVLILLPEIALGAQWLSRFHARFAADPAGWHSELGHGERRRTWRAVAEGRVSVVVGARSALFLPFRDLGLIVVDEEHDAAFKQDDGVAYNARDMAVVRARLGDLPIALVSATPSLETVVNVERGRYACVHLPDRHAGAPPPAITVVDLRNDPPPRGGWLSPGLRTALADTVADGAQALLFLNRRGYAPLTLCRACGHRLRCPSCTAWLVEHRLVGRLQCHHCGYGAPLPDRCPACGAADSLAACGPGVERLAEEVAGLFPSLRTAVATSDTLTGPAAARDLVRRIEAHEIDVVIGTQIVAKGYHFPLLTLVGVVDGDLGLTGGDLRAAERTYQLLYQVAGRAGRAERPGRVLLQTHMPEHPVMAALVAGDRARFLATESDARRELGMPPFGRLAALIVSGRDERAVDAAARALGRAAPDDAGVRELGPAPAPMALLRGRHRRRLLLKAAPEVAVPAVIRRWLAAVPLPGAVRVQVDVDPYSFI